MPDNTLVIYVVTITTFLLATILIVLRLVARYVTKVETWWDDWFALLAYVITPSLLNCYMPSTDRLTWTVIAVRIWIFRCCYRMDPGCRPGPASRGHQHQQGGRLLPVTDASLDQRDHLRLCPDIFKALRPQPLLAAVQRLGDPHPHPDPDRSFDRLARHSHTNGHLSLRPRAGFLGLDGG